MRIVEVAVLVALGACQGSNCSGLHVCEPACTRGNTCDLTTMHCVPETCDTAEDCGLPGYYFCAGEAGTKTCHLIPCEHDRECDDGIFCNGPERCRPGSPDGNGRGCVTGELPVCTSPLVCEEEYRQCAPPCPNRDEDGDGVLSFACGGNDCDDRDSDRFPGHPERCDAPGHDEDCDRSTFGFLDADGDGHVSAACCDASGATRLCGDDCDDANSSAHRDAPEVCNGVDDDCNGDVDDGVQLVAWPDTDHDGYGQADAGSVRICDFDLGRGYSVYANDCDDSNPAVTPGTFICGSNPQFPANIVICNSKGTWVAAMCSVNRLCVVQPTGVGVCE